MKAVLKLGVLKKGGKKAKSEGVGVLVLWSLNSACTSAST